LIDQVTVALLVPLTVAVNVWLCDGSKDTEDGVSGEIAIGSRFTVALADLVESAVLIAFTVTFCALATREGAV